MRPKQFTNGNYFELFFVDEATALAAEHRPCAYCQRARHREFKGAGYAPTYQVFLPRSFLVAVPFLKYRRCREARVKIFSSEKYPLGFAYYVSKDYSCRL